MASSKADDTLGSGTSFDTSALKPAPDTTDDGPQSISLEPDPTSLPPAKAEGRDEAPGEVHILDFIGRAYNPTIQKFTVDKFAQYFDSLQHIQDLSTAPRKRESTEEPASEGNRFRWIHFSDNNTKWAQVRCALDHPGFYC